MSHTWRADDAVHKTCCALVWLGSSCCQVVCFTHTHIYILYTHNIYKLNVVVSAAVVDIEVFCSQILNKAVRYLHICTCCKLFLLQLESNDWIRKWKGEKGKGDWNGKSWLINQIVDLLQVFRFPCPTDILLSLPLKIRINMLWLLIECQVESGKWKAQSGKFVLSQVRWANTSIDSWFKESFTLRLQWN